MIKEYGGIFKAKYFWEYNMYANKDQQCIFSNKIDKSEYYNYQYLNSNQFYKDYVTDNKFYFSIKIAKKFIEDVDDHFAEIERNKAEIEKKEKEFQCYYAVFKEFSYDKKQAYYRWLIELFPEKIQEINKAFKPNPTYTNPQQSQSTFIYKQTGGNMKLEIHNQQKTQEKKIVLELRNHQFDDSIKVVAPINEWAIVYFDEKGIIKIDKEQAKIHGFEVEII